MSAKKRGTCRPFSATLGARLAEEQEPDGGASEGVQEGDRGRAKRPLGPAFVVRREGSRSMVGRLGCGGEGGGEPSAN